jgi:hemolysin III
MLYFDFREPFNALSHGLWLLLSVPATYIMLRRCGGGLTRRLSFLIFGLSLTACYLGSALYHGIRLRPDTLDLFERLDHVGIHLLIAGSYTPLAWNMLTGRWRWGTLGAVWTTTLVGSALLLMNIRLPFPLATCEYLALGWGALFCYFEISRRVSRRALRPLLLGGVLYSIGAMLNLFKWPVLWPGVFGPHEMSHLWVMAGSTVHFWFMLTVVVPFAWAANGQPRPQAEAVTAWEGSPHRQSPGLRVRLFSGRLNQN